MIQLLAFIYVLIACSYLYYARGRWLLNPAVLWVFSQLIFFLGIFSLVDESISADIVNLVIMLIGLCLFVFGALLVDSLSSKSRVRIGAYLSGPLYIESKTGFNILIWTMILFSVLISFLYYRSVGYNIFIDSIRDYIYFGETIDQSNVATLRLDTYAGVIYFAPGYVNQFKNTLLPLLTGYVAARYLLIGPRWKLYTIIFGFLLPLNIIFLLGTGQRGALIVVALTLFTFFSCAFPRRLVKRTLFVLSLIVVLLFSMATLFLGRGGVQDLSTSGNLFTLVELIGNRFFRDNQLGGVIGFRFIYSQPIQNGQEWLDAFRQLLPGSANTLALANILHAELYNSLRGTVPPSIWGSIWYDFGLLGIIVVPFLMGLSYQWIYMRLVQGKKTLIRLAIFSTIIVLLGTWAVSDPTTMINRGIVTVAILNILVKIVSAMTMGKRGQQGLVHLQGNGVDASHLARPRSSLAKIQ